MKPSDHVNAGLHCTRCEYDLRGLTCAECPECGYLISKSLENVRSRGSGGLVSAFVLIAVFLLASACLFASIRLSRAEGVAPIVGFLAVLFLFPAFVAGLIMFLPRLKIRLEVWAGTVVTLTTMFVVVVILLFFVFGRFLSYFG